MLCALNRLPGIGQQPIWFNVKYSVKKAGGTMERQRNTIITGSGSYIPTRRILNEDFIHHVFYEQNGTRLARPAAETIEKFEKITGIRERRYAAEGFTASDMGYFAANEALISSMTDPESLDYVIFAHNFGDVRAPNRKGEFVPALSSRVKQSLNIRNASSVALDLPFGCAGWLQGVIFADQLIQLGKANKIMVSGAETLSRVCAPHDRDSMIYADGGGAMILEAAESEKRAGILASIARSYNEDLTYVLKMDKSSNPDFADDGLFLKMNDRKLYENMLKKMPSLIEEVLNTAGIGVADLDKILIHQANEKMDEAILKQVFNAQGIQGPPEQLVPMTISWLGNSSVATLPTLFDLIAKGNMEGHEITRGRHILFAAMGAGVNMNALVYKVP